MRGGRVLVALLALAALTVFATSASARPDGAKAAGGGFFALSGDDAALFAVPADVKSVQKLELGGVSYERYQQVFGPAGAEVLGGQISVYRDASGRATAVTGAHYPGIAPSNQVRLSRAEALERAERQQPNGAERFVTLMIDPSAGTYFFAIETRALDLRKIHWINAQDGATIRVVDALMDDHATGVKGDSKSVSGITTLHSASGHGATGAHYDLFSTDNRQWTFDAKNRSSQLYYVTDADNHWTTVTSNRQSPGQPALTDAQYYANASDDYFQARPGFNWTSCYTRMQSVAHYNKNYNNAFWNGTYTVYGDGDGIEFREFSGSFDVVAHEHAHGITDCTSDLVYQNESGALNESFSDVLGNSAEFWAASAGRDPAVTPDWLVGEDIDVRSPADVFKGFRNMGDPREDDDPDHYSERYTGTDDNGGVHSNSAIPNHAYYLLVNGGKNAGCDAVGSNGHSHTADCGVTVTAIGLAQAEQIFFRGFTGLPANATMCQARKATEAQARTLYGTGSQQEISTNAAWNAVGVPSNC
ncbi:MAG: M4 family metallopeptidase [Actinomycetota bacterium]|nr:M4 family metallopeptidase [Actinomycetota bacterium]